MKIVLLKTLLQHVDQLHLERARSLVLLELYGHVVQAVDRLLELQTLALRLEALRHAVLHLEPVRQHRQPQPRRPTEKLLLVLGVAVRVGELEQEAEVGQLLLVVQLQLDGLGLRLPPLARQAAPEVGRARRQHGGVAPDLRHGHRRGRPRFLLGRRRWRRCSCCRR